MSHKDTSEQIAVESYCSYCGLKYTRWEPKDSKRLNIKSKACRECETKRAKKWRGKSFKEISKKNLAPPVKIFTREEIDEIAHTITVPERLKPLRYFRV